MSSSLLYPMCLYGAFGANHTREPGTELDANTGVNRISSAYARSRIFTSLHVIPKQIHSKRLTPAYLCYERNLDLQIDQLFKWSLLVVRRMTPPTSPACRDHW